MLNFLSFQAPDDKSIKSGKQLLYNCRTYNVHALVLVHSIIALETRDTDSLSPPLPSLVSFY